jgi:hypothetical protein
MVYLGSFTKFKLTYKHIITEASTLSLTTELDLTNLSENTRKETYVFMKQKGTAKSSHSTDVFTLDIVNV